MGFYTGGMSETLLKLLSSELHTIRIHCRHPQCGRGVIEVPIAELAEHFDFACPLCQTPLGGLYLKRLSEALAAATEQQCCAVEFVLPGTSLAAHDRHAANS